MKDTNTEKIIGSEIEEAIDFYRGLILDLAEQEFLDSPKWPFIRGRLLKALGDRGLSGRVREILSKHLNCGGQ